VEKYVLFGNRQRELAEKQKQAQAASQNAAGPHDQATPTFRKHFVRSLGRALLKALLLSVLFASPLLVIAAVYWSSAEARGILLYIAGCLAFAGFLGGIGWEVKSIFGKIPPEPSHRACGKDVAGHVAEKLMPSPFAEIFTVGKMIFWLARKDFGAQERGRGQRALVGAGVLGITAVVFFGFLLYFSKVFAGYTVLDSLLLLGGALLGGAAVGGLIGALSDSF
jgi:hypothetical protein